jgi:hypothetical protein
MTTFVKDAAERATKTAAQAFLGLTGIAEVFPAEEVRESLEHLSAGDKLWTALICAGLSIVTSLLSKRVGPGKDTASVVVPGV